MPQAFGTTIEHVRVRRAQMEAPAARQRLSYLFSSLVLQPPEMAPSAVLVVRSMSDPLPGRIALELAAAAAPCVEWENAAQARLEEIYRKAARPAAGAVPSSAEAVLFADQGELLACLALDVDAHAANSWWWKSILRHRFSGEHAGWLDVWTEHPLYVPSALQQLDKRGQAARILNRMTSSQAWRLLLLVGQAFGLPEGTFLASERNMEAWSEREAETRRSPNLEQQFDAGTEMVAASTETRTREGESHAHPMDPAGRPPWESYVGAASIPEDLGLERRALLGVSLLLGSAPQRALSESSARELNAWLRSERKKENQSAGKDERRKDHAASSIPFLHLDANRSQPAPKPPLIDGSQEVARSAYAESVIDTAAPGSERDTSQRSVSDSLSGHTGAPAASPVFDAVSTASSDDLTSEVSAKNSAERTPLPFQNGCHTRLGGVFYLIHLLRQSRLVDFNVGLGGWALLELIARCLMERVSMDVSADPAWAALAQLDGRDEGIHPGTRFEPLHVYEAPEPWLRNLESTSRYIRFRSGRVELWHPEGFLTRDSQDKSNYPTGLDQLTRLNRQKRRSFRWASRVCPPGLTLTPELRRFLHFVLPYARWRLRQTTRNSRIEDILLREGTLYVTHSHVDLVMGMNQISIPARVAGLDANPGWAPKFGKVINFHFVQKGFGHA